VPLAVLLFVDCLMTGLVGNGTDSSLLQSTSARSTKSEGLHRAGINEDIKEDIPNSENLSNNEENTDDFFGSKSSSKYACGHACVLVLISSVKGIIILGCHAELPHVLSFFLFLVKGFSSMFSPLVY